MNTTTKNVIYLLLSTLLGGLLMGWIYRGYDFTQLTTVFGLRSNYLWITLALCAGVFANLLRSLRWHMLLQSAAIDITTRRAIELVFISYLINSVTPRLGELTRSLLVKRGCAKTSTRALGTVVVEKLADVGCLIVVVGLAVILRWESTVGLVQSASNSLKLAVPTSTFFLILGGAICLLIGFSLPFWKHLRRFFLNLWQGITAIARLERPGLFLLWCFGIWSCNFLQLYLLLPCFAELTHVNLGDTLHIFAAASIGVLLPTPAGAGPWHFAIVKTLTSVYGVAKPVAQSFTLVTHGLKTVLVMLLGILGYLSYFRSVWTKWKTH